MAWTAPSTATTGQLITAAFWNQQVKDNFLETYPAKVTTAGDLAYATGANAIARLAIGASGTMLQPIAGLPAYSNINVPKVVRKTADDTRTTTTLTNDTHLKFPILANEIWVAQFYLICLGTAAGGLKTAITFPAAADSFHATGSSIAPTVAISSTAAITTSGATITAQTDDVALVEIFMGIDNGANAGDVQLQTAQNVASGTSTIYADSFLVAHRIS